jgi:hypothetical protein
MSHIATYKPYFPDYDNMSYEETAYYIYGVDIDRKHESNIS